MPENELRNIFIKDFVREIILNYPLTKTYEFLTKEALKMSAQNFEQPQIRYAEQKVKYPALHGSLGLYKLKSFIIDPSVESIECPGPEKLVILTKNGMPTTTGLKLNDDEIKKIIKEFSEKTRIPIVPGVFKAALGNFVVTAVISDYVGTRFVIQKKNPFY